jgi:hypothetical protein
MDKDLLLVRWAYWISVIISIVLLAAWIYRGVSLFIG